MRAWRQIMQMTQFFLITSNNQDLTLLTILTQTTQTSSLCHHYHLPCLLCMSDLQILHPWHVACPRNHSLPNIAGKRRHQSMNSRNTSNFLLKTSTHAIWFICGLGDELSSQIYSTWLVTYCVFLMSHQSYTGLIFNVSPASAVAVERIFSGGHDTISLQCASLHAKTICIFMLIKKRLHLAYAQANASLHHWAAKVCHIHFCLF